MLSIPDNGPAVVKANGKPYSFVKKERTKVIPTIATHDVAIRVPLVSALSVRVSDRWEKSIADKRKFEGKRFTGTSVCISYKNRDRSDAVIFRNGRAERKATKRSANADAAKRDRDIRLQSTMGSIHEGDN